MSYFTACIAAVPTANRDRYRDHAAASWELFRRYGATGMVETWGVDVPPGKVTDFRRAVEAGDDETVVFSWITWPDRATADTAWQKMGEDPAMEGLREMPFDGSRMIWGGFEPVFERGEPVGGGWYQGFALAVPEGNRDAYVGMAGKGWDMFGSRGALGTVEAWGADVPHGKRTDFYRATRARDGEVIVFSWINWPDRATCDEAAKAMERDMAGMDMSDMPFDGQRMMWAGFQPLFDSGAPPPR